MAMEVWKAPPCALVRVGHLCPSFCPVGGAVTSRATETRRLLSQRRPLIRLDHNALDAWRPLWLASSRAVLLLFHVVAFHA
jgi:hypothetical protein